MYVQKAEKNPASIIICQIILSFEHILDNLKHISEQANILHMNQWAQYFCKYWRVFYIYLLICGIVIIGTNLLGS